MNRISYQSYKSWSVSVEKTTRVVMSFLKRIGSVRKKGSYRLSVGETDRPHSQVVETTTHASRGHGIMHCHVTLLDDSVFSLEMNVREI